MLQYNMLACIETRSTDGISFGKILYKLVERQSDALINFKMGGLQVQDDSVLGPSRNDDADGRGIKSVKAMY